MEDSDDTDVPGIDTDSDSECYSGGALPPPLISDDDSDDDGDNANDVENIMMPGITTAVNPINSTFPDSNDHGNMEIDEDHHMHNHIPNHIDIESDSEDSGWSTIDDDASETSDTDDDFPFYDSYSEDSSIADEDEYDVFEMLTHHFELFTSTAPSFFGMSLQALYNRVMETLTTAEERDTPTPQTILDSLPLIKVTIAQVASNESCCICFGEYLLNEDLLKLPCSHYYHKPCILNWLLIKSTCPTCRLDLTKQNNPASPESSNANSPAHSANELNSTVHSTHNLNSSVQSNVRIPSSNRSSTILQLHNSNNGSSIENVTMNSLQEGSNVESRENTHTAVFPSLSTEHINTSKNNLPLSNNLVSNNSNGSATCRPVTDNISDNLDNNIQNNGEPELRRTSYETEIW